MGCRGTPSQRLKRMKSPYQLRKIQDIIPRDINPRTHSEEQIQQLKASIQEWGFTNPILVDEKGVIIAGHGRLVAAQGLLDKVPTITIPNLTEPQKRALVIADNQLALNAGWDIDLLRSEIQTLDFDIDLFGFDKDFIANLLHVDEGLTDPDDLPEQADAIAKPGEIWALGVHRLMCGDATNNDDVIRLLAGVKPHLMVTDPPYGVEYDADWRNHTKNIRRSARAVGKVENDDRSDWRGAWTLFPGDVAYVWHAGNNVNLVADSLATCNFEIRAQIIWVKNNIAISRGDYHWKHEPCWYVVRKGKRGHYCGGRKQSTVWEIDKPMKSETGHSTQKPVECMRRPIINNSSIGQAVYDPFSGSGTTIIAAEMEGRCCLAMEIMPEYVDMAIKRWENYTGNKAELQNDKQIQSNP